MRSATVGKSKWVRDRDRMARMDRYWEVLGGNLTARVVEPRL